MTVNVTNEKYGKKKKGKGGKTKKKAVKGVVTSKTTKTVTSNKVVITLAQATTLQKFLAKNNKSYKFLDTKISNMGV